MDIGALLYPKGLGRLDKAYVATVLYGELRHSHDFDDFEEACYYLSGSQVMAELFEVTEFVEGHPSSMKLADIVLGEWFPTMRNFDMAKVKNAIKNKTAEDDFIGDSGKKEKPGKKSVKMNSKQAKGGKENTAKEAKGGRAPSIDGGKKIAIKKQYEGKPDTLFSKKWALIKDGITVDKWRARCSEKGLSGTGFPFLNSLVAAGHIRLV